MMHGAHCAAMVVAGRWFHLTSMRSAGQLISQGTLEVHLGLGCRLSHVESVGSLAYRCDL